MMVTKRIYKNPTDLKKTKNHILKIVYAIGILNMQDK